MSNGAQIGGVIGAAVGAYFGGPQGAQLGYMIGSTVGGYIDPAQVFGPRMTDASTQTAMDGVPRTYGYGTFPTTGNLIWCSELKERKKTESSKGAPTETVTYHYFRSYAIAVCEGPAHGNGIAGYRIVKRNGKVVYDTRTDAELTGLGYTPNQIAETRAAQAKWLTKATFYYGVADQEPDPTIQAVKGADETPGYSYTAYMVVRNEELTETHGAVPQYEFIVSVCGARTDVSGDILITGSSISGPKFCKLDAADMEFTTIQPDTGADLDDGIAGNDGSKWCVVGYDGSRTASTLDDDWVEGDAPSAAFSEIYPDGSGQWIATSGADVYGSVSGSFTFIDRTATDPAAQSALSSAYRTIKRGLYYYSLADQHLFRCMNPRFDTWDLLFHWNLDSTARLISDLEWYQGQLHAVAIVSGTTTYGVCRSDDEGISWPLENIIFSSPSPTDQPIRFANVAGDMAVYCYGGSLRSQRFGWEVIPTGIAGVTSGSDIPLFADLRQRKLSHGGKLYLLGAGIDSDKLVTYQPGTGVVSAPIQLPITGAVSIVASNIGMIGEPIPDAPGYYVNPITGEIYGPTGTTISQCAPDLAEIVEDQCALRDVTTVDVSELDQPVLGFRIANTSSPQKNILAAQPGYFFDSSEFDGLLHFPRRGGDDSFHIPFADMCPREPDTIQWERTQEAELLRKITFTYFDPRATYTPTSQTGERRAGTTQAMGESASQLPLVGTGEWAAQAADINLKAAWAEPDECTFPVSLDWAELVTAAVGTIEDERGTIHRVRIADIKDDGLQRMVTARRTDAAAYRSNAAGKPVPLPTFPGSDLRGPTTWGLLNMPAVLDTHDRPGVYWGATGAFSAWAGAVLQVLRAGEWLTIAETVAGATVGTLAADLAYHAGDYDTVNTLSLRINSTLESVSPAQLLTERNPLAIAYDDGTVEVVQFQDAEIDTDGVWHCTTLLRRRLNTRAALHGTGARVLALDSTLQFVDLRPDDLGKTLSFRVVGAGTDPDTATPFTMTFDRIWSSTEWEVAELYVERDGDDFSLSWIPRHRLGTDVSPLRSANWDGYLVRWQHSDQFFEEVITATSKTYTLPGASDVTFTVAQLNRLTGAGPETTVMIP